MQPLLLIQTGEAPTPLLAPLGGFADWFQRAMRVDTANLHVVRVDHGEALPAPREVAGAVVTGSAAMVTELADWSERTAHWIRTAFTGGIPMFGVCYGHQLMAHALGGTVGWLPSGISIGTKQISCAKGSENNSLALPATFPAQTTHRQAVLVPPPNAQVLGHSEADPNHLLRYGPDILSVQFHPEFTPDIMRGYLSVRASALRSDGLDPEGLTAKVTETEDARAFLEHFAESVLE